jgi:outer membrane protein assembly factor BamE
MRNFFRFFTLLLATTFVGCGASVPTIKPYKMDIQQGNVVTSEMLLKLRPGMTKSQVQFIMGTPLLVDSFHTNRWDYFYQLRKEGKIINQRRVILDFEKDLLVRVRGDVVPKGATAADVTNQLESEQEEKTEVPPAEAESSTEPVVQKIEAPDVEIVEPVRDSSETNLAPAEASGDSDDKTPASILAVPIPVVPAASTDLDAKTNMQSEKTAPAEPLDMNVEEDKAPVVAPAPLVDPNKPDVESSKQTAPVGSSSDTKRVFRMDRQLDNSRIKQQEIVPQKVTPQNGAQESKESQNSLPLDEEDPGFFERMLEKIGF